ncbi:MAG: hypothetical protein IKQ46_12505 [Bacteroidales bacterium]|nr:hypothetical protein [Bacteroidales bacterium]
MKKQLLILSIPALTLLSCGGNPNQSQNNTQTADTATNCSTTTDNTATPKEESVLQQVWNQIKFDGKDCVHEPDFQGDTIKFQAECGQYIEGNIYCFALEGNAYKVLLHFFSYPLNPVESEDKMDSFNDLYLKQFDFKDGKLTECTIQDELKRYKVNSNIYYKNNILNITNYETNEEADFVWDGKKFVIQPKQESQTVNAKDIFMKKHPEIKSIEWYQETPLKCYGYPEEACEGCNSSEALACYPLNDGGYLVVFESAFGGPGCSTEYSFYTQKFLNDKFTNVDKILPLPQLDDLLNPDKTANYKQDIDEFRKLYEKSPDNYLCYEFQPPKTLTVRLHAWDCEEAILNMDKVMLDPYQNDKVPQYKWDGEKFVKE